MFVPKTNFVLSPIDTLPATPFSSPLPRRASPVPRVGRPSLPPSLPSSLPQILHIRSHGIAPALPHRHTMVSATSPSHALSMPSMPAARLCKCWGSPSSAAATRPRHALHSQPGRHIPILGGGGGDHREHENPTSVSLPCLPFMAGATCPHPLMWQRRGAKGPTLAVDPSI